MGGPLSNPRRKSVEPIADPAGVPPRTLRDFLASHRWDHGRAVDRLQRIVAEHHHDDESIGLIDETSFPKRGDQTVAVRRQYRGARGRVDNGVVGVALGYASLRGDLRCTLGHRLFLPESRSADRDRRRRSGVPEGLGHQPKWQIALSLLERARSNGVRFKWLTFDAGYGANVSFLEALDRMGQSDAAEVPASMYGGVVEPTVPQKQHHVRRRHGRPKRYPRLSAQSIKANRVDRLCRYSCPMRDRPWQAYHIQDGVKGPIVWRVKSARFLIQTQDRHDDGRLRHHGFTPPSTPRRLIAARHPVTHETKCFVSNAPAGVPIERVRHAAFGRRHIQRCFQDEKDQLGLDQFERRRYVAVGRHLVLTAISHLFLARTRLKWIEEGPPAGGKTPDDPTGPPRRRRGAEHPPPAGIATA